MVVGGGVAGLLSAHALCQRGFQVTLLDADTLQVGGSPARGVASLLEVRGLVAAPPRALATRSLLVWLQPACSKMGPRRAPGGMLFDAAAMPSLSLHSMPPEGVSSYAVVSFPVARYGYRAENQQIYTAAAEGLILQPTRLCSTRCYCFRRPSSGAAYRSTATRTPWQWAASRQ